MTSASRTVLVCLPAHTDREQLADLAAARLTRHGLTAHGPVPHFVPATRRSRKLLNRRRDTAAGGPIGLLDLDAMRVRAHASATAQWQHWRDAVAGTRTAQPFWVHAGRHHDDPAKYPLARVQQQYLTQPRVQAMTIHNALPNRAFDLPTTHLEAFQAGQAAYAWMAWLAAVPADGFSTAAHTRGADRGWLTPTSGRLDEQLAYLRAANAHLVGLHPGVNLVALHVTT